MPVSLSSIDDADAAHRLEHVDLERADAQVGRLLRCAPRRVERVLLAVAHDAEPAVEDAEVRVQRGADAEVELAVVLVPVEPVAVVGVAVAARGRRDRAATSGGSGSRRTCSARGLPWVLRGPRSVRHAGSRRTPRKAGGGGEPRSGIISLVPEPPAASTARRPPRPLDDRGGDRRSPSTTRSATSKRRSARCTGYLSDHFAHSWAITDRRQRQHRRHLGHRRAPRAELDRRAARCTSSEKGRGRALRTAWSASDADGRRLHGRRPVHRPRRPAPARRAAALRPQRRRHRHAGSRRARGSCAGPKRELISRALQPDAAHDAARRGSPTRSAASRRSAPTCARALLPLVEDKGWFFDTELLVLAERNGLRIHEVPVDWVDDPDSRVDIVRTAADDLRGVAGACSVDFVARRRRRSTAEPTHRRPVDPQLGRTRSCASASIGV